MSVNPNDKIIIEATLEIAKDKAICVLWKTEEFWLPKSQITYDEDADIGQLIEIEIPIWLARDKGVF